MKWIKHMTDCSDRENTSALLEELGPEGYGIWWLILEGIGRIMDNSDKTSARFTVRKWTKMCCTTKRKLQKVIDFQSKCGNISVKYEGDFIEIDCPQLALIRDEYSRKQKQDKPKSQDNVRTKSGECQEQEVDTEVDTEKDIKNKTTTSPRRGKPKSEPKPKPSSKTESSKYEQIIADEFESFWESYPPERRQDRKRAFKAFAKVFERSLSSEVKQKRYKNMELHLNKYLDECEEKRSRGDEKYIKMPATWLNAIDFDYPPADYIPSQRPMFVTADQLEGGEP